MFHICFAQYLIQFAVVLLGNLNYSMSFYLDSYGPKTTPYRTTTTTQRNPALNLKALQLVVSNTIYKMFFPLHFLL